MLSIIITGTPRLETESPYIISVSAKVQGDPMELKFIGDYARALTPQIKSLRYGDCAAISGKVRDGAILVERFTALNEIKGRNLNFYG